MWAVKLERNNRLSLHCSKATLLFFVIDFAAINFSTPRFLMDDIEITPAYIRDEV